MVTLMTTQWAASCETLSCMRLAQAPARSEGWLSAGLSMPCSNKTAAEQDVITRNLLGAFNEFFYMTVCTDTARGCISKGNAFDGVIQQNRNC